MIVAVDFDGTLFEEGGYPYVGAPIKETIDLVLRLQEKGVRLILWTCRTGEPLERAVKACESYGIHFVAINQDDPLHPWREGNSRKVYADFYIDDRVIKLQDLSSFVSNIEGDQS